MKKLGLGFLYVIMLVSFSFAAQKNTERVTGRKLSGKIGVGFNSPVAKLPALAGRYWLSDVVGIEGFLGFKINDERNQKDNRNNNDKNDYAIGIKFLYVVKAHKNFNVFSTLSLANVNERKGAVYSEIKGGVGIEWFVMDELSLSTEAGISLITTAGNISLETNIENIPRISIKYYL
jgi:hypothetical protein